MTLSSAPGWAFELSWATFGCGAEAARKPYFRSHPGIERGLQIGCGLVLKQRLSSSGGAGSGLGSSWRSGPLKTSGASSGCCFLKI